MCQPSTKTTVLCLVCETTLDQTMDWDFFLKSHITTLVDKDK